MKPKKNCSVHPCGKRAVARGWCPTHYQRWNTRGAANAPPRKKWDGTCKRCHDIGALKTSRLCKACNRQKGIDYKKAMPLAVRTKILERARIWAMTKHRKRRAAAIVHYGGKCNCCGEQEPLFLVIDHINGGGNEHRRSLNKRSGKIAGSYTFYAWLVRNNWPTDFQLLCHNCNFAKGKAGVCPHKNNGKTS